MTEKDDITDNSTGGAAELLNQLLHLKRYETPDPDRMSRNRQNIMRRVREVRGNRRWSLSDLLEINIPWFFAEPRYGIAALFMAFAMLQFWGISARRPNTGSVFYVAESGPPRSVQTAPVYTNSIVYPEIPDNLVLFPDGRGNSSIKPAASFGPKK